MIGQEFSNKLVYNGKQYTLRLDFRNVLEAFEVMAIDYPNEYKIALIFDIFVDKKLFDTRAKHRAGIVSEIFEKYINILPENKKDELRSMDFSQDFKYIYSSFKQTYSIDLLDEDLSWQKFISDFVSLPSTSKINEIIHVRKAKIPAPTKNNQEQIANLIESKDYYKLDIPDKERSEHFQRGLARFAKGIIDGQ